ncbi:hypothetical protein J6590_056961 [Homalodisca vitripennis]|nr:hypothetical protein J6590_056961 [Homalodisca vitripennis]
MDSSTARLSKAFETVNRGEIIGSRSYCRVFCLERLLVAAVTAVCFATPIWEDSERKLLEKFVGSTARLSKAFETVNRGEIIGSRSYCLAFCPTLSSPASHSPALSPNSDANERCIRNQLISELINIHGMVH